MSTFPVAYPIARKGDFAPSDPPLGRVSPLLLDYFAGSGPVAGRAPNVGAPWGVNGAQGANLTVSGGTMFLNGVTGTGTATNDTPALIGEIGCKFRLTSVINKVVVGGTPATGSQLIVNIYPSRNANFYQVSYTLNGTDTLATAATALASAISANAQSVSNSIAATASGTTVSVTAAECPRVAPAATGALTLSNTNTAAPTLANYPTGQNYASGMIHFRLGVEGLPDWTFYNNGQVSFSSLNRTAALVGLQSGVDYTYRCCIGPPYVWGGLWIGTTLLCAAWGQDAAMGSALYRGKSCFFENGLEPALLLYEQAWAYRSPTVSLAAMQAKAV